MNILEVIAVIFGLISTWLYVKQNSWSWPTGLVMVSLYFVIFYQVRLYADMSSQLVFIGIQFYGWRQWLRGGADNSGVILSHLSLKLGLQLLIMFIVFSGSLGFYLNNYTDGQLVYWDALTTVASIISQWMLAQKIIENWLCWVVIDIVFIGMFLHTELYLTAGLYAVFLFIASQGYIVWNREYKKSCLRAQKVLA